MTLELLILVGLATVAVLGGAVLGLEAYRTRRTVEALAAAHWKHVLPAGTAGRLHPLSAPKAPEAHKPPDYAAQVRRPAPDADESPDSAFVDTTRKADAPTASRVRPTTDPAAWLGQETREVHPTTANPPPSVPPPSELSRTLASPVAVTLPTSAPRPAVSVVEIVTDKLGAHDA